jgi:hypothetical protein
VNLGFVLLLLATHFVGDFVLQSDRMATNKSKSNRILAQHVGIYSACFLWIGVLFVMITAALHFVTDYVTSRWTSRLYAAGRRHDFFVVIGLDQLIHAMCLLIVADLLE